MTAPQELPSAHGGLANPDLRFHRRELLRIGGTGFLTLSLSRLLQAAEEQVALPAKADACIIVMLNGGPSHLDMWDMKPDAPAEVRGPFKPITTTVPGVHLSEHLRGAYDQARASRGKLFRGDLAGAPSTLDARRDHRNDAVLKREIARPHLVAHRGAPIEPDQRVLGLALDQVETLAHLETERFRCALPYVATLGDRSRFTLDLGEHFGEQRLTRRKVKEHGPHDDAARLGDVGMCAAPESPACEHLHRRFEQLRASFVGLETPPIGPRLARGYGAAPRPCARDGTSLPSCGRRRLHAANE